MKNLLEEVANDLNLIKQAVQANQNDLNDIPYTMFLNLINGTIRRVGKLNESPYQPLSGKKGTPLVDAVKHNATIALNEAMNNVTLAMEQLAALQEIDNHKPEENRDYRHLTSIWHEIEEVRNDIQDYK